MANRPDVMVTRSDVLSLVVALYAIKVRPSPCPIVAPTACSYALCIAHTADACRLSLLLRVAQGRDTCGFDQWCLPSCLVFLDILGGHRTFLQHARYALALHLLV